MRRTAFFTLRIATLLTLLLSQSAPVSAQEGTHAAATESVSLQVGDIFEVLPVHDIADALYTWILTQDRTFLEASRAPSFRKRLIQPGQYTLYGEITSPDGSRRFTRTIALDYAPRQPGTPDIEPAAGSGILVRTEPAADENGKVIMQAGTQLLRLTPVNPDIVPLALDLDLSRDADGDGKPDNDIQTNDTFFSSDATPLYLWITNDPLTSHGISVTAAMPDGAKLQRLDILSKDTAMAQGIVKSPIRIETQQIGDRTYVFSAVFESPAAAAGQLLYQWQFGDDQQSLVTKPQHTYAEDGIRTVSLLIRNLRDGTEVASTSLSLNVTSENPVPVSSEASSAAIQEEEPEPSGNKSSFNILSILLLAALFLGSILLGVGVIILIGKLRGGKTSLADKLETIEQSVVKTPAEVTAPLTIAPPVASVTPKRTEPPVEIAEREKAQAVERPATPPPVQKEAVPAWLAPATAKPASSPAPAPTVPPTPKPTPAPVQTPKKAAPAPIQTPSWLQQPTASASPKPSAPNPPAVSESPVPAPTPTAPKPVQVAPQQSNKPAPLASPKPVAPPVVPFNPASIQPPKQPVPVPPTPTPPAVEPKPAPAPTSIPSPQPVVPFNPASIQPPKQPSPAPAAVPVTPPETQPATAPAPEMEIQLAGDQPIAIIRAESLNPQEQQNG